MARTRMTLVPKKKRWTISDLSELYIEENFSMDLVSTVTGIPIAPLSHIFWDSGLPDRKRAYYNGYVVGELNKVPPNRIHLYFDTEEAEAYGGESASPDDLVDEFLSELDS